MYLQIRDFKNFCFILSLLFFTCSAVASEAPEKHDGKEAAVQTPKKRTTEESYSVVLAKVQALEAKVRSAEQEIQKLVTSKAHAKSSQQVNEIIKTMLTTHHELKKNIQEYERQRSLLKYRYPEKAVSEGREYERIELKTLEQMEGEASLTASIRKTLHKVRKQFPVEKDQANSKHEVVESSQRQPASERPSLLEPVILKK